MILKATPWTVPVNAWKGQPCFIIGGGPSLKGLDFDRFYKRGVRVLAINTAYVELPEADLLYFADRRWWDWNHKRLSEEWRGGPWVSRGNIPDPRVMHLVRDYHGAVSRDPRYVAGFCSGGGAINIAYLLGADPIFLFGYDMRPGNWHDLHKLPHQDGQHQDLFVPSIERMEVELTKDRRRVFNTNLNSALRCFPFIPVEEVLSMSADQLAQLERETYLEVWRHPEYRRVSPGMKHCERAYKVCHMTRGASLIDFGSGPCRATKWFQDQGLDVKGVDFASNANEFPGVVEVVDACLWDMKNKGIGSADFSFCCDVMEHIPTEQVDTVIEAIASRTRIAGYFNIATRADVMGPRLVGRPLHLTIQKADWWRRAFQNHFFLTEVVEDDGRNLTLKVSHG